jgi:hypothetical protein
MDRKYLAIAVIAVPTIYCGWDLDRRSHIPPTQAQIAERRERECEARRPSPSRIAAARRQIEAGLAMDVDGKRYNVDQLVESSIRITLPQECW